jgi:drug/metabolite transporter (DMT)-like permease
MNATPHKLAFAGMAYAVAAMACFAVLDTTNKYLIASVPLLMVLWFRYLFQAVATTAVMWPRRGMRMFHTHSYKLQMVRGLLLLICSVLGFASLQRMPVAEFSAIAMLTPLVVTILARFVMKEHVSRLRWFFVIGGLMGALLIVRPGGSVHADAAWLPLVMVFSYATFQTLTSHMAKTESPVTMHIYTGWVGTAIASVLVLGAWTTDLSPFQWLLMCVIGFAGTLGHYLLIVAFSRAPASSVTPFLYSSIAFATLGGWIVFSHIPDQLATLGILLIAMCGLGAGWLSRREHHTPT